MMHLPDRATGGYVKRTLPDGRPCWAAPDRIYLSDPEAGPVPPDQTYFRAAFVRDWAASDLRRIADQIATPDAAYRAMNAADDLIPVLARLAGYDAARVNCGEAIEEEFWIAANTIQSRLGAALYRRVGAWPNDDGESAE